MLKASQRILCHLEEREVSVSSLTKIGQHILCHFDQREKSHKVTRQRLAIIRNGVSCVISPFGRNDKIGVRLQKWVLIAKNELK